MKQVGPAFPRDIIGNLVGIRVPQDRQCKVVAGAGKPIYIESGVAELLWRDIQPVDTPKFSNIHVVVLREQITGETVETEQNAVDQVTGNNSSVLDGCILQMIFNVVPVTIQIIGTFRERLERIHDSKTVTKVQLVPRSQPMIDSVAALGIVVGLHRMAKVITWAARHVGLRVHAEDILNQRRNAAGGDLVSTERLLRQRIENLYRTQAGSRRRRITQPVAKPCLAQGRKISLTLRDCRNTGIPAQSLLTAQKICRSKEVGFAVNNRSAKSESKLITDQCGFVGSIKKVAGVQHAVTQIFIKGAVEFGRSLASDDVHLPSGAPAIFGAVTARRYLELLDAVHRRFHIIPVHVGVVVIDSIEQKVVIFLASAVNVHRKRTPSGKLGTFDWRHESGPGSRLCQAHQTPFESLGLLQLPRYCSSHSQSAGGNQFASACRRSVLHLAR